MVQVAVAEMARAMSAGISLIRKVESSLRRRVGRDGHGREAQQLGQQQVEPQTRDVVCRSHDQLIRGGSHEERKERVCRVHENTASKTLRCGRLKG